MLRQQIDSFQDNDSRMRKLVNELKTNIGHIVKGGGEKAIERHTSRGHCHLIIIYLKATNLITFWNQ